MEVQLALSGVFPDHTARNFHPYCSAHLGSEDATVGELAFYALQMLEPHAPKFHLEYEDEQLDAKEKLSDHGIHDGSVVVVVSDKQ